MWQTPFEGDSNQAETHICHSFFPFQVKHLRDASDFHLLSVIIIIYHYCSSLHDLQGVSPDGQADGAGRPVPVVGVPQGEAQPEAPCRQAQTILLNVRQRGQRLGDVLLLAAWRRVQQGTQILCRHRLHLSRQTRLHLCGKCAPFVLRKEQRRRAKWDRRKIVGYEKLRDKINIKTEIN